MAVIKAPNPAAVGTAFPRRGGTFSSGDTAASSGVNPESALDEAATAPFFAAVSPFPFVVGNVDPFRPLVPEGEDPGAEPLPLESLLSKSVEEVAFCKERKFSCKYTVWSPVPGVMLSITGTKNF